ncbi:hypothetical protein PENSPDRAFT_682372 [Peniophora sp. CONT]|nr:hypothetical protein PENSPDRAFT_682372 [Peniophora sp. CONT]
MINHPDTETLEEIVYNSKICIYVALAGLVMILYDHMLTFADEVELVWKAPRSVARTLFLINRTATRVNDCSCSLPPRPIAPVSPPPIALVPRAASDTAPTPVQPQLSTPLDFYFLTPPSTYLALATEFLPGPSRSFVSPAHVFGHFPEHVLRRMSRRAVLGAISIANSNFIILLRLWVLWERQKRLIAFTFGLFVVCQLSTLGVAVLACIRSYDAIVYFAPFKTCLFVTRVNAAWLWLPGVVFEAVAFSSALWNAMQRPRVYDRALTRQFYRDGGLFFTILFALRVSNMVIAFVAPASLTTLGAFFIWCSTTLSVSRLVMNLRRAAVENQGLPLSDLSEADAIMRTRQVIQYEHCEGSQLSRNTTGDFLELDAMHD